MADEVEILKHKDFVEVRYLGAYSLERYKRQMEISVRACLDGNLTLLLVDIISLVGFQPTTLERHKIGVFGAELAGGLRKVATLGTLEQLGSEPYASMVSRNRGLKARGFTDRSRAVEWLLAPND